MPERTHLIRTAEAPRRVVSLPMPERLVQNFDNYGTFWGVDTVDDTETMIEREQAAGADIDEWKTVDRDGQPLRIVRIADPTFLDTICVIPARRPVQTTAGVTR